MALLSIVCVCVCVFVHVDMKNITMRCPNLVQIHTSCESPCIVLGHPMVILSWRT